MKKLKTFKTRPTDQPGYQTFLIWEEDDVSGGAGWVWVQLPLNTPFAANDDVSENDITWF